MLTSILSLLRNYNIVLVSQYHQYCGFIFVVCMCVCVKQSSYYTLQDAKKAVHVMCVHIMWLNESEERIYLSFTFQYSVLFKFNYNKQLQRNLKELRFMLHTAVFTASLSTDWDGAHIGSVVI